METKKIEELLDELIKLQMVALKRETVQSDLVRELNMLKFTPKRIADLTGANANAVRVSIHYAKSKKKKKQ